MAPVNLGTAVLPGSDAEILNGAIGGEAILIGQDVMEDPTDGQWKLASTANVTTSRRVGVALSECGQKGGSFNVQIGGRLLGTATLVKGMAYFASDTPGSVVVEADVGLAAGDYNTFFGIADTTTSLKLRPFASGVARA